MSKGQASRHSEVCSEAQVLGVRDHLGKGLTLTRAPAGLAGRPGSLQAVSEGFSEIRAQVDGHDAGSSDLRGLLGLGVAVFRPGPPAEMRRGRS